MRPAWAHSCGCKSRRELTHSERREAQLHEGNRVWNINHEPMDKSRGNADSWSMPRHWHSRPRRGIYDCRVGIIRMISSGWQLRRPGRNHTKATKTIEDGKSQGLWVGRGGEIKRKVADRPLSTFKQRIRVLT